MADIKCRKCGSDLEQWNNGQFLWLKFCPNCGAKVLQKQRESLHRMTTIEEISDMVREHLIDMLETRDGRDVSADELASRAWETEQCDGVVFYSNYRARLFVTRHSDWVTEAFEYVWDEFGDTTQAVKPRFACYDRLLVTAFIYATERYVFNQLCVDRDEGDLSKKRIQEILRQIKSIEYDGNF